MAGLAENELDFYSHLLTGYVGSASFLKKIAQLVPSLKQKNPNLIYGRAKDFHISRSTCVEMRKISCRLMDIKNVE